MSDDTMLRFIVSPLYIFLPIVIIILSLPLAIFAVFTTVLASITLFLRAAAIYLGLGLAVLRSWLVVGSSKGHEQFTPPIRSPAASVSGSRTPVNTKQRRNSMRSITSIRSFEGSFESRPPRSDSYASLLGAGNPDRDYEGVGGWRDFSSNMSTEDLAVEDARWGNMNIRLVLPANTPAVVERVGGDAYPQKRPRKHSRSLTWQSQLVMSPVQSRARSPLKEEEMGYFGQNHGANGGRRRSVQFFTQIDGGTRKKARSLASMDGEDIGK